MKLFLNQIGIASIAILFATATCNNSASTETETTEATATSEEMTAMEMAAPAPAPTDSVSKVQLDTVAIETSLGTITLVLFEETPLHKANFLKLCKEKYYDGLLFHRVIPGFMIQGGDPNSKTAKPGQMLGNGGPNYTIPAEFNSNLHHKRGALAAARTENPAKASSGSQFYICHGSPFELDMNYTVYGQTIAGFEVIDAIANAQRDRFDRPLNDIKIIKTTIKPKHTDAPAKTDKTASDSTSKSKPAKKSKKSK